MSSLAYFLTAVSSAAAIAALMLFLGLKRSLELLRSDLEHGSLTEKAHGARELYEKLSQSFVDVHRDVTTTVQKVESLSLQVSELKDMVARRFQALRMKIYRDGIEEEAETIPEASEQQTMLDELLSESAGAQEPEAAPATRPRLRRRSARGFPGR